MIAFLQAAFGGEVTEQLEYEGQLSHAEVRIGDSIVMIGQIRGGQPAMPAMLYLYLDDCDAAYARALAAGATSVMAPADMYYADRTGAVADPCGNQWWISTRLENLSNEELQARHAAEMARRAKP